MPLIMVLMPLVLVLAIGGFTAPNPSAVMMAAPVAAWQPKGILTITRHPVMWAFGLWALALVAANGDLAGLIFFGATAVLALFGMLTIAAVLYLAIIYWFHPQIIGAPLFTG